MNGPGAFLELLRRDGVVRAPNARLVPMAGGVSGEIFLVEDGAERFVVKRAMAKLNVQADWFADVNRNRHEWKFIRYVAQFLPQAVPALRHCSANDNYFAMEYLNSGFTNWKKLLLEGKADAARAGNLLAQIHRHSDGDDAAALQFQTAPNFFQLRIEPYLLATGAKYPALHPLFEAEAVRLAGTRQCLIHGDFTPKNILVDRDRMVLLDCECAWFGDPTFDLASLLNHFFLKSLWHAPGDVGMNVMIEKFWSAYQTVRPSPELESRAARLLLMLMLARVDGKSPVEYLDSPRQQFVREFVQANLPEGNFSLRAISNSWFSCLCRFKK